MKVKGVPIQPSRVDSEAESPKVRHGRKLGQFTLLSKEDVDRKKIIDILQKIINNDGLIEDRKSILREFLISVYGMDKVSASTISENLDELLIDTVRTESGSKLVTALRTRDEFLAAAKDKEEEILFGVSSRAIEKNGDRSEPVKAAAIAFRDRSDRTQKASEFLEEHYGPWLRGNGLYRPDLRKFDKSLSQALNNEFRGRFDELAQIVPTKRSEINSLLGPDAESMSTSERKRALDSLRTRLG